MPPPGTEILYRNLHPAILTVVLFPEVSLDPASNRRDTAAVRGEPRQGAETPPAIGSAETLCT